MQDKIEMQENSTVNTFDGVIEAHPDSTIISAIKQESFSGTLPHPSVLEGYEKLREGSIDQIFAMADREQQFRMETVRREEDQKDRLIVIAEKESEHNIKMEVRGGAYRDLGFVCLCFMCCYRSI